MLELNNPYVEYCRQQTNLCMCHYARIGYKAGTMVASY